MIWDGWQKQVLTTKGNMAICSGRQSGKSTVISEDAKNYAVNNPKKNIMIIASVERQALLLFEKVLSAIYREHKHMICKKKKKPTKHKLELTNGSIIYCLPTGDSGYGIRGYTIDRLYADEAAFIHEDVWAAVTPMLATTGGDIILLSTPMGATGYFYRCFHDKNFTSIHVNTEEIAKTRQEPQKTLIQEFLKDEKERMSKLQYQQEYLGLFVGGIMRFFEDSIIDQCCTLPPTNSSSVKDYWGDKYQGIDIARMGGDDTVLISVVQLKDELQMFDMLIPEGQTITDTARLIIQKDKEINHKKIYIDTGGMGVGVYDLLMEDQQTKRKTVSINNARKTIDKEVGADEGRKKVIDKVNLYNNLKSLMEKNKIRLFDDPRVRQSLRSMQYEISEGKLRIYGNFSHIAESLIRAAFCVKDKSLNIYIY